MVFNSHVFLFAFLPSLFTMFWLARSRQQRYVLLTVSGYVFYGYWNWRFCFLLLFSSLVSFVVALLIQRAPTAAGRRAWMITAIGIDLSILGFFKYYNFFVSTLHSVSPGWSPMPLDIVLPIGISFYTFHTISYVVDVAAGGLDGGTRLHAPALLRLQRLLRHGSRSRPALRCPHPPELQHAVSGRERRGFLAALAHEPVDVAP